jgi:shikimate dehydrogenase
MKQLYVIGDHVENSFSPIMHSAALKYLGLNHEYRYDSLHLKKNKLPSFVDKIRNGDIHGASVTIPFKETILQYVDTFSKEVEMIQAANTIYNKDGKVIAHNKDGIGFIQSLQKYRINIRNKNAIIIGSGGAAKAIAISLILNDIESIYLVNRTEKRAKALSQFIKNTLHRDVKTGTIASLSKYISDKDILINATSVGMKGNLEGVSLIPSSLLTKKLIVFDIIYNPRKTALLIDAEKKGAKTINGIGMLIHQGAEQFKLFTGKNPPISVMKQAILEVI